MYIPLLAVLIGSSSRPLLLVAPGQDAAERRDHEVAADADEGTDVGHKPFDIEYVCIAYYC